MVLEICSDSAREAFEVRTKDNRFLLYKKAYYYGNYCYAAIRTRCWYEDLDAIATFVNNELKDRDGTPEPCIFCMG